jgi:hypothetical protein
MSAKCQGHRPASFDQLVGAQDQTGWYLEAEGLRSPEIDYHLQLRRLLNRQVGRHERDQASTVGRPQSLRWWWGLRRDFTTVGSVRDLMLPEAITRLPPCAQNAGRGRRPARNRGHGKSVCGLAGIVETEMHNVMRRCGACGRTLAEQAAWKGSGERYYCNEFCADDEGSQSPSLVPTLPEDAPARVPASAHGRA